MLRVSLRLKKEELKYNDDEEVSIEEFDGLDAEIDNEEEVLGDYEVEESSNEEVPTWSHDFDEGPPKLEERELEAWIVSRGRQRLKG